jgi:hypothetical protein
VLLVPFFLNFTLHLLLTFFVSFSQADTDRVDESIAHESVLRKEADDQLAEIIRFYDIAVRALVVDATIEVRCLSLCVS